MTSANVKAGTKQGAFRLAKPAQDHLRFDICGIKKTFISNDYRLILKVKHYKRRKQLLLEFY